MLGDQTSCTISDALASVRDVPISGYLGELFIISGSTFGTIFQEDTSTGENYKLGSFSYVDGHSTFYTKGDFCPDISDDRSTEIEWTCGENNFVAKTFEEPSVCRYKFIGEVRCCDVIAAGKKSGPHKSA